MMQIQQGDNALLAGLFVTLVSDALENWKVVRSPKIPRSAKFAEFTSGRVGTTDYHARVLYDKLLDMADICADLVSATIDDGPRNVNVHCSIVGKKAEDGAHFVVNLCLDWWR